MAGNYGLIIFDVDGTFYKFRQRVKDGDRIVLPIRNEVIERGIDFIAKRLYVSVEAAARISRDCIDQYGSVGLGLERAHGVNRQDYINAAWNVDPSKYIDKDERLRELILGIEPKKAVLTASPSVWIKNVLNLLDVGDVFDGYWFGDDEETKKPNTGAYTQILDAFGMPAEQTLIVDDEIKNLMPAKELGMTTVLVGDETGCADYNIGSVHEFPELLRRLS